MKLLVICNAYPSGASLYRNGFIHRRVKGYMDEGIEVEVFYNHEPVAEAYRYHFDGVDVVVGNEQALKELVSESDFDAYLVHFAEPSRIRPLQEIATKRPIIIWVWFWSRSMVSALVYILRVFEIHPGSTTKEGPLLFRTK